MNLYKLKDVLKCSMAKLKIIFYQFEKLMEDHLPGFSKILKEKEVSVDFYGVQWFITLFSYDVSPNKLRIIWDFFLYKGWKFIFKFALAIAKTSSRVISLMEPEVLIMHIKNILHTKSIVDIIKEALNLKITNKMLRIIENKYYLETSLTSNSLSTRDEYNKKKLELDLKFDSNTITKNREIKKMGIKTSRYIIPKRLINLDVDDPIELNSLTDKTRRSSNKLQKKSNKSSRKSIKEKVIDDKTKSESLILNGSRTSRNRNSQNEYYVTLQNKCNH